MKVFCLLPFLHLASSQDLLWATSGGGWRAMAGSMAYANVYAQAGLFSDSASSFTGVSSNSGGTWFSAQFFYSQQFYDAMQGSPEDVSDFFTQWMNSYKEMTPQDEVLMHSRHKKCEQVRDMFMDKSYDFAMGEYNRCVAIREVQDCDGDLSWACYVNNMLRSASENYGDSDFYTTVMNSENRISPLQSTTLAAMIGLSPTTMNREGRNECTFIGPSDTRNEEIYNTVLPLPYLVSNDKSDWLINYVTDSNTYIDTCNALYGNYEEYYTPGGGSTTIQYVNPRRGPREYTPLSDPFGGSPNVVQIASASSAAGGATSPLTGALFEQVASMTFDVSQSQASTLYNSGITDWMAVCSQWPETYECAQDDAQFIDGGNVDNPALVSSIAAYQKDYGTTNDLKVVLNVHNQGASRDVDSADWPQFVAYFSNPDNVGVDPGGYIVLPNDGAVNPLPSPQIFEDDLSTSDLLAMLQDLDGTQSQYATFKLTTIDNAIYGIQGGQSVELLVFFLNYDVTTNIFTEAQCDEYTPILADMIVDIASSQDVLDTVQSFFGLDDEKSTLDSLVTTK